MPSPSSIPRSSDAGLFGDMPLLRLAQRWLPITAVSLGAGIVALGASFLLPKTYLSSAVFVPEQSKNSPLPSGLGALAGQFGLAAGAGGTDSPEFYQRLLAGRSIREAILSGPLGDVNLYEYFAATNRPDSTEKALKKLSKVTSVSIDKAAGTVRIDVEFRHPKLAFAVATKYLDLVNDFNSSIRRTQAAKRRQFVQAQTDLALAALQGAETRLKDFLMRNRTATSPALQYERGELDRRVTEAQELYLGLSRQLQSARIDEVNDTPVISVVDPPFLPTRKFGPHRAVIVLMSMFIGALIAALYVIAWPANLWRPADGG